MSASLPTAPPYCSSLLLLPTAPPNNLRSSLRFSPLPPLQCVLDSCRYLEGQGFDVTYLPVEKSTGLVNLQDLANVIRKGETSLVSVMAVNNEIGTLQPLKEIGEVSERAGIRQALQFDASSSC